eukprot:4827603-Pleurochrysis_carterae.AAC.1
MNVLALTTATCKSLYDVDHPRTLLWYAITNITIVKVCDTPRLSGLSSADGLYSLIGVPCNPCRDEPKPVAGRVTHSTGREEEIRDGSGSQAWPQGRSLASYPLKDEGQGRVHTFL